MALTKKSESNVVFLEVKHYCLWRGLKSEVDGCEYVDAKNPATGGTVRKYGYRYDTVSGRAVKLAKYDTGDKYNKRYFGFKLHLVEGIETYVIDMPYQSQILRRFLRLARSIDWSLPLSITIFKGKKKEGSGAEDTGVWFQQRGETVKPYYTREQPHGMPEATQDPDTRDWDFKPQQRWLVARLQEETIPDIDAAASRAQPPAEIDFGVDQEQHGEPASDDGAQFGAGDVTDEDIPF